MSDWIPVSERLPEPYWPVLVFTRPIINGAERDSVSIALSEGENWFVVEDTFGTYQYGEERFDDCADLAVTHWMPLPEPPND